MKYKQHFSRDKARVVWSVFCELANLPRNELRQMFGTDAAKEICQLAGELRYYDYCDQRGIKYEDMTEEDFVRAYEEMWGE